MRKRYWVLLGVSTLLIRSGFSSSTVAHVSYTDQDNSTSGLIFLTEDTNVENIRSRRKLRELLSPSEYMQALDTIQHYDKNYQDLKGSHLWTWRAKDYQEFDDSVLVEDRFTAKLILVKDNTLGGGRQYFFQIRTYTRDNQLIDQAEFASWSETKKVYCSGWLTDDRLLIRNCDGTDEIKRINQNGRFIIPSQRTIMWLKLRGY